MTLSELRDLLTSLLDEDGVYRSDAVLNEAINDAYHMTAMGTQCCEVTKTFTVSADSLFYYLPDDIFVPISVYWSSTRLYPVRMDDLDQLDPDWMSSDSSTPVYYFMVNLLGEAPQIWFSPPASASAQMRITYASLPGRMTTDTDVPRLPSEYHPLLADYAFATELLKEFGWVLTNKAFRMLLEYLEGANRLRDYMYKRTPDRDWEMMPWDTEALRQKMLEFERLQPQLPQGREATDLQL